MPQTSAPEVCLFLIDEDLNKILKAGYAYLPILSVNGNSASLDIWRVAVNRICVPGLNADNCRFSACGRMYRGVLGIGGLSIMR